MNQKNGRVVIHFSIALSQMREIGEPRPRDRGAERDQKFLFKYLSVMAFMTQDETTYTHETDMTTYFYYYYGYYN